jgi:hypothetical protein
LLVRVRFNFTEAGCQKKQNITVEPCYKNTIGTSKS